MVKKILLLSDANSEHTEKWAISLAEEGFTVGLFSLNHSEYKWYHQRPGIEVLYVPDQNVERFSTFEKLSYPGSVFRLKRAIRSFQPDILHAHYASSYGLLAALSGFHPYVISVWGADVYDFPRASLFQRKILENNLNKADLILSTSATMKTETERYTKKPIYVTPFGVDTQVFSKQRDNKTDEKVVIGITKSLETKYGVDVLLKAFALAKQKTDKQLFLYVIGVGTQKENLLHLKDELGLNDAEVVFTGRIPNKEIPRYLNKMDIFTNPSVFDSESFGVSIVEAMACELPVVATKVGGLGEVIDDGKTGILVPPNNAEALAEALLTLIRQPQIMQEMGAKGREKVLKEYDWKANMRYIVSCYQKLLM